MKECPKCKSSAGYTLYIISKYKANYDWDNNVQDGSQYEELLKKGKIGTCQECGHKFRIKEK